MQYEDIPQKLREFIERLPSEDTSPYSKQQKSMEQPSREINEMFVKRTKAVEPTRLWQLIKNLEEKSDGEKNQLNEMVATLLINFSEHNKGRLPVLISDKDTPICMLIKVLNHYVEPTLNGTT